MGNDLSDRVQAIRHGMFIMPFHDPAKPLGQCYAEDLELIVRAEELGFSEFWIGEHHTMKYENIVMPEIFIARALGETRRIRMGPAPVCLNQHHPAHVAGRLAFLDHLSGGRLNLCFGAGSVTANTNISGFGMAVLTKQEGGRRYLRPPVLWRSVRDLNSRGSEAPLQV